MNQTKEAPAHDAADRWLKTPAGKNAVMVSQCEVVIHRAVRAGYLLGVKAAEAAKGVSDGRS